MPEDVPNSYQTSKLVLIPIHDFATSLAAYEITIQKWEAASDTDTIKQSC